MNKKILAALCAVLMVGSVLLTSCGDKTLPEISTLENKGQYVTLGTYKGVEVKQSDLQKSIQTSIDEIIEKGTTTEKVTDRAAKLGDTVNIDYTGYTKNDNGEWETFSGGSAIGTDLELGSKKMIDGFEDAIVGFNVGDEKDIEVTFPESYSNTDLAGKPAKFTIKVNSITAKVEPELNDKLVAEHTDFETLEEYRASLTQDYLEDKVWDIVLGESTMQKYPEEYVKRIYDNSVAQYEAYAKAYGMTFSQFCVSYMGSTEEATLKSLVASAKSTVKNQIVVYYIAELENITVSDEEYPTLAEELRADYGDTYADVAAYEEAMGGKEVVRSQLVIEKTLEFLADNAKIIEDKTEDKDDKEEDKGDKEEDQDEAPADSTENTENEEPEA